MKVKLTEFVALFLFLTALFAQAERSNDPTFTRLSKVGAFAFGGIGFAGITSEGEKDFRIIFASSSALTQFEHLLVIGNPQAKAYALVGIRRLDLHRYNELSAPLRGITSPVTVFRGCIMSHDPFVSMIKSIDAGDYDAKK